MNDLSGTGQSALDRLAALYGILPAYHDVAGAAHHTRDDTKRALLATMGVDASTDAAAEQALAARQSRALERALPPVAVFSVDEPALALPLTLPVARADREVTWTVTSEEGQPTRGALVPGRSKTMEAQSAGEGLLRYRLDLTAAGVALPAGYHRLELEIDGERTTTTIVVAPTRGYRPPALSGEGRVWGLAAQLYALRSRRNWGSGDFGDLLALIDFAASAGADVVALNPLHALHPSDPARASPYSPSSRLFGNPLYLDVQAIPEFAACEDARRIAGAPEFRARIDALRAPELIDYPGVAAARRNVLDPLYRCFRDSHRHTGDESDTAFAAFVAEGGEALRRHALFDAIAEKLQAEGIVRAGDWRSWPLPLRDVHGAEVARFAAANAERVEFHAWLQWHFERQLDAAAARGSQRGLGVGLLHDLAVGIDPGGSEAWSDPALYGIGAAVGAPPDAYNVEGQNWGLPPLVPERLRESAYAPFIATLRRNMRGAGALRIDHVMGLMRLYWIPDGAPASAGAYVVYPFEDMLSVLSLESQRNRCLVIGEDLGTVPDEVRAGMRRTGILSLRPMYFEVEPDGSFVPPERYMHEAAVSIGTHDLPTVRGFWQVADLDVRHSLGQFAAPGVMDALRAGRDREKRGIARALAAAGLFDDTDVSSWSPALALAAHRFLARTPAKIMLVSMEDVFGQVQQVNLPGTVNEYPNWRRKLERPIEEWARDSDVRVLIGTLTRERPSPVPKTVAQEQRGQVVPRATYRLQLNSGFTFRDATAIVPYLAALGVSHVYLSPYFKARAGSTHGYDIVDHDALNPEIGTRADFERLCAALREHGMHQLADVVPNHVGVLGTDHPWWRDVLENGRAAAHASFFDIDWDRTPDELHGKLLLPVLGERYGTVLERGEIKVALEPEHGEFAIRYAEQRFPVDPRTYDRILRPAAECLRPRMPRPRAELAEALDDLATAFASLPPATDADTERGARRRREQAAHKRTLADLCERAPEVRRCIDEELERLNGRPREPASFDALDALLGAQVFRLASWRMAGDDINYRRFFDLNDLAALRMEDPAVFDATHRFLFELFAEGRVAGLRIDHPDGLHDPEAYFGRLQSRAAETLEIAAPPETARAKLPVYIVAEKITGERESLPISWPIAGSTGYDFAGLVNGLFVDARAEPRLTRDYFRFIEALPDFGEIVYRSKRLVMNVSMASELNALASALSRIAQSDRATCDFTYSALRAALAEVVASFPVYRTYVTASGASAEDRRRIDEAIHTARRRALASERTVFEFLRDVLTTDLARQRPESERAAIVHLAMRFQQFTAPVMAKGMEDTAFYNYNRLVSLNEVGGDPRRFGVSVAAFHEANLHRAADWPHAMLATSTHDAKRSEDVRARIDVLSELAPEWRRRVERWRRLNRPHRRQLESLEAPTPNDEYLLYQTLVGAWPERYEERPVADAFVERIERYLVKVVREEKAVSSWLNPNEEYEAAFIAFARALVTPGQNERFLAAFLPFEHQVAWFGRLNALSQTLLKLTAPGVPDIYQGCELWDLSLVDPDNRRPVDFAARRDALAALQAAAASGHEALSRLALDLLAHLDDGRFKQLLIWRALAHRRDHEALFRDGAYLPLAVGGQRDEHVCAFARRQGEECAVVVVPRLACTLLGGETILPVGKTWRETYVDVGSLECNTWEDALTGRKVQANGGRLAVAEVLGSLPVALLAPV